MKTNKMRIVKVRYTQGTMAPVTVNRFLIENENDIVLHKKMFPARIHNICVGNFKKEIANGKKVVVNSVGGWCTEVKGEIEIISEHQTA